MLTNSINTLGDWISKYGSIQDSRDFGGVVPAYPIFMFIGIIAVIMATIIKMRMKKIPLNELYWAILIIVPVGIIGGSIFGKAFNPGIKWYQTLEFWDPGMSLFGAIGLGTVGGFAWFYKRSKVTQISVWVYADCILPNVLLGQAIGRWGNMYNHEIMGNPINIEDFQWLVPGIRDKLFYWGDATSWLSKMTWDAPDYAASHFLQTSLPSDWSHWVQKGLLENPSYVNPAHYNDLVHALSGWLRISSDDGNTWYYIPERNLEILAHGLQDTKLDFREPLFLYESLANTFFWLILTFIVPNLSRWIQGKGKYPWDIQPNAYPGWYNPNIKVLSWDEIESWSVQRPIKYKETKDGLYTISFWEAWNKAYYLYEPNEKEIDKLVQNQDSRSERESVILEEISSLKDKYKGDLYRLQENFSRKTNAFSKKDPRYEKLHTEFIADVNATKLEFKDNKKNFTKQLGGFERYFKSNPDAGVLEKLNNPNGFFIIRSGVLSGAYILGYMIIRIILETHRRPTEYFVQNNGIPDFIVLGIILAAGLFIILWTTFVSPYKYREVGWLYEKSY